MQTLTNWLCCVYGSAQQHDLSGANSGSTHQLLLAEVTVLAYVKVQ